MPRCFICGKEIGNLEKEEFTYYHGNIVHLRCYLRKIFEKKIKEKKIA